MKITLVMVQSLDGKTTRWDQSDVRVWTSAEDQQQFTALVATSTLVIMGTGAYEGGKAYRKLSPKILRIVCTHNPTKYESEKVPGQLEFTDESPELLVHRLEKIGYIHALLVGGSGVNTAFFAQKLISDCLITVEPKIFGQGKGLVQNIQTDISLALLDIKRLNDNGTLLLHYTIMYEHTGN
jgi:dihydrofolate reductase